MHQINHCFIHEVVNIFISSCVHIFIHVHQERGDELLIKEKSLATSYRGFFIPTIREFFEKMLLLIRQCNTFLEEIMMVTKQNY